MTETVPRLLIVDAEDTLGALIRAAFMLMERRCRIVTAGTAVDAFDELGVRVPDVLLTTFRLRGEHNGIELATQARQALATLPIIVVAEEDTPDFALDSEFAAGITILRRPFLPEALFRALRTALNEPDFAPAPLIASEDLGPVPSINLGKLQPVLVRLTADVGARVTALVDRTGAVLLIAGSNGYIDLSQIAQLIRPAALSTAQLTPMLGERMRTLSHYDGAKFNVFSLGIGLHHFVFLVFDGTSGKRALGTVRQFGNQAIDEMLNHMGDSAMRMTQAQPDTPPPARASRPASPPPAPSRAAAAPPVMVASYGTDRRNAKPETEPELPPDIEIGSAPIEGLDLTLFDAIGQMDINDTNDPFAPDRNESLMNTLYDEDDGRPNGLISQPRN